VESLREDAIDAVIRYLGQQISAKDTPPLEQNPAVILRDSVHRAQSVGFHIDLLKSHFGELGRMAGARWFAAPGNPEFLLRCRNVLTFLSDDVLFNSLSMLDYLGNLVGYIISGPNAQRLKWNGAAKAALDSKHKLSTTETGRVIARLHREWIDRLHVVRSEIIHERVALGDGGQTISFQQDSFAATLDFHLPAGVPKRLKFLQDIADEKGRVDVVAGSEVIGLRAIDAARSTTAALLQDLGGRVQPPAGTGNPALEPP
jgi:hypothetical protein